MREDHDVAMPRISVSRTSTRENRTGSWKYIRPQYRDGVAPCNARCPTGVDVEGYMNLLRQGRREDAVDLLLRENPIPAITGRVCHHPCESACNRAHFDEAVAVHAVERTLGDEVLRTLPAAAPRSRPETVAIVGSGPAGLACAYHLVRLGYGVRVFDDAAEAGGMLRQGIPAYRLPRAVLDRQIEWLSALGVEFRCGVRVDGLHARALLEDCAALFLATGAHRDRPLGVPGEDGPGVRPGLEFLKAVNRGERPVPGERVVVVGGGNTAMDCARTALRLGARATVLYRRTRAEMPAIPAEIEEAAREGVNFVFLAAPGAFVHQHGRLVGVVCALMELGEPDASGRRRPVVVPGGEFTLPADTVLTAVGEEIDADAVPHGVPVFDGAVLTDALGNTEAGGVFAGGDVAGASRTVADALGSGKAAAIGIDRYLSWMAGDEVRRAAVDELRWADGSLSMSRWRADDPVQRRYPANDVVTAQALNFAHFAHAPRAADAVAPTNGGGYDFGEVNLGLALDDALAEAGRCCNCGVCNDCELCLIFCPDAAITRSDGGGFDIDLSYCKGCGVCAYECPRGALVMTREGL
jgi:NADPH-dependent glutamate synthase beta subunit-like oxidoreductase/Pyruvate/2-oxoacid:ferredoxin oxidoreductase delta subunit